MVNEIPSEYVSLFPATVSSSSSPSQSSTSTAVTSPQPWRSSALEELDRINAGHDAQMKALADMEEAFNSQFDERDFTTVEGLEIIIDRDDGPPAKLDDVPEAVSEEAAEALLRYAEWLMLMVERKEEESTE